MEIIPVQPPPKNFASGGMYRTVRSGPRGNQLTEKTIKLPSMDKGPCPPAVCRCKGAQNVKSFYKQPPRRKDFAPSKVYRAPTERLEDGTIYKMSFMPSDGEKPDMIPPRPNIRLSNARFPRETIHKMSFAGTYMPPVEAIRPCDHYLGGRGPISSATSNRCDYYPKDGERSKIIPPHNHIGLNNAPFESNTTNALSYKGNDGTERTRAIMPNDSLFVNSGPLEVKTIHKMSYQPCKIPHKMFLPWAQRKPYQTPCIPMSSNSVYKNSYVPTDDAERTKCIYPERRPNILTDGNKFETNTIYHMSFKDNEGCTRSEMINPRNNIYVSNARMEGNTTQKLSYMANDGYMPPSSIRPCNHDLMMGRGPMACGTTTRCDYQAVEGERPSPILPNSFLSLSNAKFAQHTTNRLSFMNPEAPEVTQKIPPRDLIAPRTGCLETNTIQKMSYQPVQAVDIGPMPWAEKKRYCPPAHAMVDDTCYRMSYEPPGDWVGGGGGEKCECDPSTGCPCYA